MRIALTSIPYINREEFFIDLNSTWKKYKLEDLGFSRVFSSRLSKKDLDEELDNMIEVFSKYSNPLKDNVIFSISPIDFLVKLMFAIDDQWIPKELFNEYIDKIKPLFNNIDVIFYLPISKFNEIKIPDSIQIDEFCDAKFLADMNENIQDLISLYNIRLKNPFFDVENCPAIIEIFGSAKEKIANVKMYIDKKGVLHEPKLVLPEQQAKLIDQLGKDLDNQLIEEQEAKLNKAQKKLS